jgi:hypothetical protein
LETRRHGGAQIVPNLLLLETGGAEEGAPIRPTLLSTVDVARRKGTMTTVRGSSPTFHYWRTGGVEEGVHGRFRYGRLKRNFLGAAARAADWSSVDGGEGVDGRFGDGELERTFLGAAARAADWSGRDCGISEAGAQRARALMAGSEFPSQQPRG